MLVVTGGVARAAPLLDVPGQDIASEVTVAGGVVKVAFGFRVRAKARALWDVVRDFRRYPKLVDGLREVRVRKRGRAYIVRFIGKLIGDYSFRVHMRPKWAKKTGEMRFRVLPPSSPSTGRMRVDRDGEDAIFSLRTRAPKPVDLPDFLVAMTLKAAVIGVGEALRKQVRAEVK